MLPVVFSIFLCHEYSAGGATDAAEDVSPELEVSIRFPVSFNPDEAGIFSHFHGYIDLQEHLRDVSGERHVVLPVPEQHLNQVINETRPFIIALIVDRFAINAGSFAIHYWSHRSCF